jgi:hypothetical protein
MATPTGFEGPGNADKQRVTDLNLLVEVAREWCLQWPEAGEACRRSLQNVSAMLLAGDVVAAGALLSEVIAAFAPPAAPSEVG